MDGILGRVEMGCVESSGGVLIIEQTGEWRSVERYEGQEWWKAERQSTPLWNT